VRLKYLFRYAALKSAGRSLQWRDLFTGKVLDAVDFGLNLGRHTDQLDGDSGMKTTAESTRENLVEVRRSEHQHALWCIDKRQEVQLRVARIDLAGRVLSGCGLARERLDACDDAAIVRDRVELVRPAGGQPAHLRRETPAVDALEFLAHVRLDVCLVVDGVRHEPYFAESLSKAGGLVNGRRQRPCRATDSTGGRLYYDSLAAVARRISSVIRC